jgi:hypothetical protein
MKMTGRYASATTKVHFEEEYEIELISDIDNEELEEPFECVDITEVVYLNNRRFVIDNTIAYEQGKTVFATRYDNHGMEKSELQLTCGWDAKEYTYTITTWEI